MDRGSPKILRAIIKNRLKIQDVRAYNIAISDETLPGESRVERGSRDNVCIQLSEGATQVQLEVQFRGCTCRVCKNLRWQHLLKAEI